MILFFTIAFTRIHLRFCAVCLIVIFPAVTLADTSRCHGKSSAPETIAITDFEGITLRLCRSFLSTYGTSPDFSKESLDLLSHVPPSRALSNTIFVLLEVAVQPVSAPNIRSRIDEPDASWVSLDVAVVEEVIADEGTILFLAARPGGLRFGGNLRLHGNKTLPFKTSCSGRLDGGSLMPKGVASCSIRLAISDHNTLLIRYSIKNGTMPIDSFSAISDWVASWVVAHAVDAQE